jgi:uncharacterized protein
MLEKIKAMVKDLCNIRGTTEEVWWLDHIRLVEKRCLEISEKEDVDKDVLLLAAWLHDLTKITQEYEDHHIKGAERAGRILEGFDYPEEKIKQVQHCIITHSSDPNHPPLSKEAKLFADIDGISHFEDFPAFAHYAYGIKEEGIRSGSKRLRERYERCWGKLSPRAKEMAKDKYNAIKTVLKDPLEP